MVLLLPRRHRAVLAILCGLILMATFDIAVPFLTRGLIDNILHSFNTRNSGSVLTLVNAAAAIFFATPATRLLRSVYNYRLVFAASQAEDEARTLPCRTSSGARNSMSAGLSRMAQRSPTKREQYPAA